MCSPKLAVILSVTLNLAVFVFHGTVASATGNDPCRVLTAAKFGEIMAYAATINKTASTQTSCFYQGPAHGGGQFMILTETATGPQADMMLKEPGATPPPGEGMIGGAYKQGSIIFAVSIKSADQAKLQALVAEIRRNLK